MELGPVELGPRWSRGPLASFVARILSNVAAALSAMTFAAAAACSAVCIGTDDTKGSDDRTKLTLRSFETAESRATQALKPLKPNF